MEAQARTYQKHPDLTGIRVGRWSVLGKSAKKYNGNEFGYDCRCDCGAEKMVRPASLHNRDSLSCGCLRSELKIGKHLIGARFGMVTVLGRTAEQKNRCYLYRCACDCGREFLHRAGGLSSGKVQSCGCRRGKRHAEGIGGFNLLRHEYKTGAASRGHEFSLTDEEFRAMTSSECFYCGSAPVRVKNFRGAKSEHAAYVFNGIDRVDNARGYVADNCVACCTRCNVAKGTLTQEAFLRMARAIASRHRTEP